MKKLSVLIFSVFVIFSFAVNHLNAQDKNMHFNVNFGVITDDSFSFDYWLWSAGAQLDFHLGPVFMISPEVDVIIYKLEFDPVLLAPGVMANIKLSNFFFGAGISYWGLIGTGVGPFEGEALLKVNVGLTTHTIKLTLYSITTFKDAFSDMAMGLKVGFGL